MGVDSGRATTPTDVVICHRVHREKAQFCLQTFLRHCRATACNDAPKNSVTSVAKYSLFMKVIGLKPSEYIL